MALGSLFLRTFVKSQLHAAGLFSFEMNNWAAAGFKDTELGV